MRCVTISASDDRMDCRELFDEPLNPLPRKCHGCGFPDLDHVPQPYVLIKSRTMSPNELALAENGNFLIRERVRRVLDLVAPGLCTYFPTCFQGTTQPTPWRLAVPTQQVVSSNVKPSIPRCEACGEPRSAHPGTQWSESLLRNHVTEDGWTCELDHDVAKSATWGSSERGWDKWIMRDLFLSVRLLHLLKKIKAKGFFESTCQKPKSPNKEEAAWIKDKLLVVQAAGIPLHADGTLSDDDTSWLRNHINSHSRPERLVWDVKAVERRVKAKLPKSYIDFITAVGPASFHNVDRQEGFTASILAPDELGMEFDTARLEDEESKTVKALIFAKSGHGDCFCFDVQKSQKEYAVFLFKHEYNHLEPYADNFAACIKRFVGGSAD